MIRTRTLERMERKRRKAARRLLRRQAEESLKRPRLLRVTTEYFVAGAIWRKIYGIWSCTEAAPIIHWMVGMNKDRAFVELLRMGAAYEWVLLELDHGKAQCAKLMNTAPQRTRSFTDGTGNDPRSALDPRDGSFAPVFSRSQLPLNPVAEQAR